MGPGTGFWSLEAVLLVAFSWLPLYDICLGVLPLESGSRHTFLLGGPELSVDEPEGAHLSVGLGTKEGAERPGLERSTETQPVVLARAEAAQSPTHLLSVLPSFCLFVLPSIYPSVLLSFYPQHPRALPRTLVKADLLSILRSHPVWLEPTCAYEQPLNPGLFQPCIS